MNHAIDQEKKRLKNVNGQGKKQDQRKKERIRALDHEIDQEKS